MKYIKLTIGLLFIAINILAKDFNDTINVVIDLKQVDSLGLRVNVYPPADLESNASYTFPKTIPGIYENLHSYNSLIKLKQNDKEIPCIENSFSIECSSVSKSISYLAKSSVNFRIGVSAEDTYYIKDSIYILNWHYLLGFFQDETDSPYKIKIIKNSRLYGTSSLDKEILNDTVEIYTASNYKDLIHCPLLYSIPDTTSFQIGESNFNISCVGNASLLNAKKIKDLLFVPLKEVLKHTEYKHKDYTFIYFSEYSITSPGLRALEHPNSTLVCYHTALLDNNILIGSSIHEYIHAIYAPLRIRSEVINDFNFINPVCDEFLWFYEGVTEYLSIKTLLDSKFFSNKDFLNEIKLSNEYSKDFNFSKTSQNIYDKKGQKLYDNFYTTGSLFALQLDLEIMQKSNGKQNLFDVMNTLQQKYSPEEPFNSKTFVENFIAVLGIEKSFLEINTEKKINIDFNELVNDIGYNLTIEKYDTIVYSYSPRKIYNIVNFKKNQLEIGFFGSILNKELNAKKIVISEINGEPINWFNRDSLIIPSTDKELELLVHIGDTEREIKAKPSLINKERHKTVWVKNDKYNTELVRLFWND
jgi:predicted metalloprotease with PDZ domain